MNLMGLCMVYCHRDIKLALEENYFKKNGTSIYFLTYTEHIILYSLPSSTPDTHVKGGLTLD